MLAQFTTLTAILTVLWFLVYWIFGGVVFSVISLVRPGRMKRVRFSCLYTLLSIATGYFAAWLGVYWAALAAGSLPATTHPRELFVAVGGLGFVGILLGLLAGFIVAFLGGWVIMLLARSKEPTWLDRLEDETGT